MSEALSDFAGFWISLDGVDGAGKTTVATKLAARLPEMRVVPEFSEAPVGQYLASAVREQPHVISASLLGQSLAFLSDFFYHYELVVADSMRRGHVVLSDRGPLSKHVYQTVVLEQAYDPQKVRRVLDGLFDLIIWPDLTVYLRCDPQTLHARLRERDGFCDSSRMAFLTDFEARFHAELIRRPNVIEIYQPRQMTADETAERVLDLVRAQFTRSSRRELQGLR